MPSIDKYPVVEGFVWTPWQKSIFDFLRIKEGTCFNISELSGLLRTQRKTILFHLKPLVKVGLISISKGLDSRNRYQDVYQYGNGSKNIIEDILKPMEISKTVDNVSRSPIVPPMESLVVSESKDCVDVADTPKVIKDSVPLGDDNKVMCEGKAQTGDIISIRLIPENIPTAADTGSPLGHGALHIIDGVCKGELPEIMSQEIQDKVNGDIVIMNGAPEVELLETFHQKFSEEGPYQLVYNIIYAYQNLATPLSCSEIESRIDMNSELKVSCLNYLIRNHFVRRTIAYNIYGEFETYSILNLFTGRIKK